MSSPYLLLRRWLAVPFLVVLACHDAAPTRLHPGLSLSGKVKAGLPWRIAFDLRRDRYLALRVTQESLDAKLTLHPPDGKAWATLDTQSVVKVPELLRVVAPRDGRYVLEVGPSKSGKEGPFRLEVVELRPATLRDRLAVKAQNRLAEAEVLRRRNVTRSDLQGLPLYEEAVRLFSRAGDVDSECYARVQWARVLQRQSRKEEAAASLRGCLALPPAAQASWTRARAATLLAEVLDDLGQSAEADGAGREALDLWRRLKQPVWEAKVINDLAQRASKRGELARAEGLYRQALSLFEHYGEASAAAVALGNLASVYNLAGEPQLALDAAAEGLARFPEDAPLVEVAAVLARKGEALANLGRREGAQRAFDEAFKLLRSGPPSARAELERRLARRAYDQGDFEEAAKRYRSALETLEAAQDRQSVIATRQDLAWTELKRGHLDAAEGLFESMSAEIAPAENHWVEAAALAGRARLERARGRLEPAVALARQALDSAERIRQEVGRTDLQTSVFAGQQAYFDLALDLLLELYDRTRDRSLLVEAFETSERSRARRLLDLLAADPSFSPRFPSAAEVQSAELLSRARERLNVLRSSEAAASVIDQAEREVREAVLNLRRAAAPGFGGTPLAFDQIQRWIDHDTVLLEFDLGEDTSYLWVISRRQLSVHRLPAQSEVEALVREAFRVLSSPGIEAESVQGRQALLAASRRLLGEAMAELSTRRWLVVMDGALHTLPLGALPNPESPGEPLLAEHEIAYSPSASVAVRLSDREHRQRAEPGKELAVFADAMYEARASSPNTLLRLSRLRYSDDEARNILAFVPPEARLDAQRFEATKERVLSGELAGYRRLHFAVHGLPDENHPELSGLAMSLFDRQGRPLDGIVFAHEISRLHLSADLVVLSACQSGRGAAISGEGLVGLVHAFFTAGTARVIASDWAVNDQATAELMSLFYDGLLRRRLTPASALQQAQLALSRRHAWRRPYYWAGFVVQGGF